MEYICNYPASKINCCHPKRVGYVFQYNSISKLLGFWGFKSWHSCLLTRQSCDIRKFWWRSTWEWRFKFSCQAWYLFPRRGCFENRWTYDWWRQFPIHLSVSTVWELLLPVWKPISWRLFCWSSFCRNCKYKWPQRNASLWCLHTRREGKKKLNKRFSIIG